MKWCPPACRQKRPGAAGKSPRGRCSLTWRTWEFPFLPYSFPWPVHANSCESDMPKKDRRCIICIVGADDTGLRGRGLFIYIYAFSCFSWKKHVPKKWRTIQKIIFKWCSFVGKWLWKYPTEPQAEVWLKEDPVRSGDWKHYLDVMQQFVSNLRQKANLRQPQHKDFSIYLRVNWWNLLQQFLWTSAHNKHPSRRYCCIALARLLKLQPIAP